MEINDRLAFDLSMKTFMIKLGTLLLLSSSLFVSCQRSGCDCNPTNPYDVNRGDLVVTSNIVPPTTRVVDDTWEVSDAIGIYAINGGQVLSATTIYGNNSNRKYTAAKSGATATFTSLEGVRIPSEGAIDIVAYYPYSSGTSLEYKFDNSDQSKLSAIDVLYSNNQKKITKTSNRGNLVFKHALSLLQFNIKSLEGATIDASSTVTVKDAVVDGTMSIADGRITTGTKLASPSATVKTVVAGKEYQVLMILPPQDFNGKEVTFTLNGKSQKTTLKLLTTEGDSKYIVDVNYTKEALVVIDGAKITPWTNSGNNDDSVIIVGGEPVTPSTKSVHAEA